jgi:hypothetical protein
MFIYPTDRGIRFLKTMLLFAGWRLRVLNGIKEMKLMMKMSTNSMVWNLLEKVIITQSVKKYPASVEPRGSSLCSQKTTIVSYPEPVKSIPYHCILFLLCFLPSVHRPLNGSVFMEFFNHNFLWIFYIPCMLHALSGSSSMIKSPWQYYIKSMSYEAPHIIYWNPVCENT